MSRLAHVVYPLSMANSLMALEEQTRVRTRPETVARVTTCVLCGRERPSSQPHGVRRVAPRLGITPAHCPPDVQRLDRRQVIVFDRDVAKQRGKARHRHRPDDGLVASGRRAWGIHVSSVVQMMAVVSA